MKRIISFLLILALLICLVACGNDGESSSSESQAEQSSTETQSESMESESVTESETQGNTSSESTVESESQSQSTESVTESETNSESTETTTESEIESETNSESESESTTESETESEIESESSTEIESETESESESESQNPTTVAEWVEANKEQIKAHMNSNYLPAFGKKAIGVRFDANKVADVQWIFKGEDKVENVKMILTYKVTDTAYIKSVVTANLTAPISMNEILASPTAISTANLTEEYQFDYNPTIQGTRDDLVNALFKAVGVNEVGGTRYLKDLGESTMDYGKVHGYTVVEISKNEVKEYAIHVIHTSAYLEDEQAIQKLSNLANYKISGSQVIDISGASVEYVAQ